MSVATEPLAPAAQPPAAPSELRRFLRCMRRDPALLVGSVIVLALVLMALFAPLLAPYGANENVRVMLGAPSWQHPFGTNVQGRDLFSRVILGSRNSLGVAFPSVALAIAIGLPIGMLTGYIGGRFDSVFIRLFDIVFALPTILFAIALVAYLGPSTRNLILTIAVLYIPRVAMVARAPTLSIKTREYVLAARMFGSGLPWVLRKHILPNIAGPMLVEASLLLSTALLTEAALSFLGLGIQPPEPSWGADLGKGREFMELGVYQALFPGLMIMLAVLGFNLLGDGLRDFFDPRIRKSA
ncbi:ABC transporter permease [Vineibacter terrae]|uniref:ABC transporter permease n=1 Tax=Vineibacter terrae TaxID=2586908 RepID=UPI002E334E88|nr:ABC transporter permease [Vineibacter terrae]HEX2889270.1 ABC transporter permease [Vineibacter terrae]